MKKSAWYVVLLLVVLILAIVVSMSAVLSGGNDDKGDQPGSSASSGNDGDDEPDIILPLATPSQEPVESPEPSEEPEPSPEPSEEPEETPEPEPSQEPVQNISASGSFASNTGTGLNLQVDWSAYNAGDGIMLQVDVAASSYSIFTSGLYNSIELTVNGTTYYASSPEIVIEDNELHLTPMASFTIPVEAGSATIEVLWHYRGSYSGVELEEIVASGSAYIG